MSSGEKWAPRQLGASLTDEGVRFRVFTTEAADVEVELFHSSGEPGERKRLACLADGLFELLWPGLGPGTLYQFVLDGQNRPDPFARFLPLGVHGPAEVIAPEFVFQHHSPLPPAQRVFYEIHIGTFTEEGTYEAASERLAALVELGVTTIELMPVAAFPGRWGWGYDGVAGFAPFAPYGRPEELKRLIDRAHGLGLEVVLDVVYNHFGPDGNYLGAFSQRYFDPSVETPWGQAPRFADAPMRSYVIESALHWLDEFRFDGLRFDGCHAIFDTSALHILAEVAGHARSGNPNRFFVAEDERNDVRELERMGVDAVWADDFHHVMHVLMTGERDGYYAGYEPNLSELARTIERGFLYEGQPFLDRGPRGRPADWLSPSAFIYCLENHDQVGNRPTGSRLSHASHIDAYRAASALLLFLPMTPLLFMGQEWAASSPFCYFTDHEPELGKAVSEGRRREFAEFRGFQGSAEVADPQAEATYRSSQLNWSERELKEHAGVLSLYQQLLALRRSDPVLSQPGTRSELKAEVDGDVLIVRRKTGDGTARLLLLNWGEPRSRRDFSGADTLLLASANLDGDTLPEKSAAIFEVQNSPLPIAIRP